MVYMASDCVDMSRTLANDLADPPDYSRTPIKLCTDYLAALKKQAWAALEERYGMRTMQIDWVITVPAVWSTKAKSDTLKCARDAGIGDASRVKIVSEPEAAAAYALQAIEPLNLREGQNFVVCDAG
jgi:molecular chaperone DnaK (HSP70)